jgi:hypothetical protein
MRRIKGTSWSQKGGGCRIIAWARSNGQHARRRADAMIYFDHFVQKDAETDII